VSTILGSKIAGAASVVAPASPVRALTRTLAAGRRGELVVLPHLGQAWVELPGAVAWEEVQITARRELAAAELELEITTAEVFEMKLARHTLARAVRDPNDHAVAFGTLEEWGELDPDVINSAWQVFGDVRERLDPMSLELSDNERATIEIAIKKKDGRLLRSFGITKLAIYMLSTDAPPPISQAPSSSNTES
jgi:hypothetical protein